MMRNNGTTSDDPGRSRRAFIDAYNTTQVNIWKDRIRILGVIRTGRLLRSVAPVSLIHDADYLDFSLKQSFQYYGIWVNFGVGREMKAGQRLPEGSHPRRRAKRWFDRSHFRSVANLRDFMAQNLGREFVAIISNALSDADLKDLARRSRLFN